MNAHPFLARISAVDTVARTGRVTKILPTHLVADGPNVALGATCAIDTEASGPDGETERLFAQVVRVDRESVSLTLFEDRRSALRGATVTALVTDGTVAVGDAFLGRVIDALGRPIDGGAPIRAVHRGRLAGAETLPLDRVSPARPLETGVRVLDGLLTLGVGQRVGIFAASGVGKTSLLSQLANQVQADRCVICLVGERGREVELLWRELTEARREVTVLVSSTSDQSATMRVRAGEYALALAEHWRAEGRHVVLFVDSATRLAMAMRELGLAAGEPPTVRAYTPSVFAAVPRLVERCGALRSGGAITAIMTILAETDDVDDPVAEMMKSLLDGHVILSRALAEQGHFPAVDVPRSVSRLAHAVAPDAGRRYAERAIAQLSTYEASRMMIQTGVYAAGTNAELDEAVTRRPALLAFLRQRQDEESPFSASFEALAALSQEGTAS